MLRYKPGILPIQDKPELKNAVERELRKIGQTLNELVDKTSSATATNIYLRADVAAPLQVSEAQTQFNDAVSFRDDIDIDKLPAASVYPLVDFTKAQYVRVPAPVNAADAATKDYVDVLVNAIKGATDFDSLKSAILASFP